MKNRIMKNIDRLVKFIKENGTESVLVHAFARTKNWIIAKKFEANKWSIILLDPMGNITYNLGTASGKQYLKLWSEITKMGIGALIPDIELVNKLKEKIKKLQN